MKKVLILVLASALPFLAEPYSWQNTANRAVSLSPAVTEIIYDLGAEDKLVGVVTPADYPPGIDKPVVGSFLFPNLERIVGLKPDVVFVTGIEQKRYWKKLEDLKLNPVVIEPESIEDIYEAIKTIGKILGYKETADSFVSDMQKEIKLLSERLLKKIGAQEVVDSPFANRRSGGFRGESRCLSGLPLRRVFVEIYESPLISCGKGSFIDEMITLAGGINITGGIEKPYPIVSAEMVIKSDPDVIIILSHTRHSERQRRISPEKRLGWQNIAAIKEGRVYDDIDENLIVRPGPRVVEGIKALMMRFYPEIWE